MTLPGTSFAATAVFFATLAIHAPVASQPPCFPFSKFGLTKIDTWQAGSELTVGRIDQGAAGISIELTQHPNLGAVLTKIGHRGRRVDGVEATFEYTTTPPASESHALWKAVLRPVGADTPAEITPESATEFSIWADSGTTTRRAVLQWRGCCAPNGASLSLFWFELEVIVSASAPNRAAWSSRMARYANPQGQAPFTIDEVHAPIVYAQQPGNSQLARILVPAALNAPLPSTNLSMRSWQLFNLSASLQHPARGQQMQFSALYAGDTTEIPQGEEVYSAHRKILYLSTEDTEGHFKFFHHDVISDPNGVAYYRWCPAYYPAYGPAPQLNCFRSPYPSVLCALQAKTDAYWYDVTDHYRSFVRGGMGLIPMHSIFYPLNKDAAGESVIVATSTLEIPHADVPAVFESFVDAGDQFQQVFRNPGTNQSSPLFMEWQKWLNGGPTDAETPIGAGRNPRPFTGVPGAPLEPPQSARDEIARARGLGINVSVYTLPLILNTDDWTSFSDNWLLHDRLGNLVPEEPGFITDFGAPQTPFWFRNIFYRDILQATPDIGGFFLDTVGGRGSFLRYPPPNSNLFNFRYHGGTAYVRGGIRLLDGVRQRVAANRCGLSHPNLPFVATEAVQEFYAGHYDAAQHGIKPLPLQTQLSTFIDQLTSPGVAPAPVEAATSNPPLWNAVYHEYSRADALGMMLSTRAVSALLGGGQPVDFNTGKVGVTWEEWGDYIRMVHALMYIGGMKSSLFSHFFDFDHLSLLVHDQGTVRVRDPNVPQQVELLAFLQRMHESTARRFEAGRFLNFGVMERPLALPTLSLTGFDQAQVSTKTNPSIPSFQRADPLLGVTRHFYEDAFTEGIPYPVASVLHSVWRAAPYSPLLGLVFVNWTDEPAAWQGSFDPKVYGCADSFRIVGVRPNQGGVTFFDVGQGQGETNLSWNPTGDGVKLRHHAANAADLMPPRSVQVFYIDPGH